MRALQARGAQVTAEEREMLDELELALKETDASDDKVCQSQDPRLVDGAKESILTLIASFLGLGGYLKLRGVWGRVTDRGTRGVVRPERRGSNDRR